ATRVQRPHGMSTALDGITVIDLTTEFWGSLAAALLGDFGADVLRIDPHPAAHPTADLPAPPAVWNHRDELVHRNKQSLAVDLGGAPGRALVQQLAAGADVVITDRPGAELTALGLDHATLVSRRPDLIYARGSGFGPKGPDADRPALDELAAARTGMMP